MTNQFSPAWDLDALCHTIDRLRDLEVASTGGSRDADLLTWHVRNADKKLRARDAAYMRARVEADRKLDKLLIDSGLAGADFRPKGSFVYLLWNDAEGDTPIYVGQSGNVLSRLGAHCASRQYGQQIDRVTLIRCQSRRHAMETESRLIRHYRPRINRAIPGGRHPVDAALAAS